MTADLDILNRVSTSTVSDALDRHGINGQALGIKPLDRSFRIIGRAFTLKYTSVGAVRGTVGDFIDDLGPGDVVAIDNNGRMDATIWGDILTLVASRRGVSGTIIDGICRDTDRALELGYPIFARGNAMRSGKDRVMLEATQVPVNIGGVRVQPGDIIFADGDGVVIVPKEREDDVLSAAADIEAAEERIREAVMSGMRLDEARKKNAYYDLQKRIES